MTDGNWHYFSLASGLGVAVRMSEVDGRFAVTDVYLARNRERVTPADLRSVQLGRYEAMANANGGGLERARGALLSDRAEPTPAEIRANLFSGEILAAAKSALNTGRPKLTRPSGTDPDAFYQAVAEAYREYAAVTKAAAARIADEADVPVTTAHRWVREARRRNFLPPGQRGRTTA